MSLYVASLNSGSNGNCYYVGNEHDAVLVDAGLACKEIERRLLSLQLKVSNIKAIVVSHEHIDHVRGLAGLSIKYQIPVYVTKATMQGCYHLKDTPIVHFEKNDTFNIGTLQIKAFAKYHDAADPTSFNITYNAVTVGVYTDIGKVCNNVIKHFKQCHAVILEANYDTAMLANGKYPIFLQDRIRGGNGHLSNTEAFNLFVQHRTPKLTHIILAHLSKDNNDATLVQQLFEQKAEGVQISVASRLTPTTLYHIGATYHKKRKSKPKYVHELQLSLF